MGVLSRFRRRKDPYAAVTEEERIARYVYLLNTLPASVIESAHAAAFNDVPLAKRREMFEQLRPFMSDAERNASPEDTHVLATLVRRAQERRAQHATKVDAAASGSGPDSATMTDDRPGVIDPRDAVDPRDVLYRAGVLGLVAHQFMMTSAVSAYFTVGAGSVATADQPAWVGDMVDPGSAGVDGGAGHGSGFDGGYDSGFGGGYDGGGFSGGFDGGGGFG